MRPYRVYEGITPERIPTHAAVPWKRPQKSSRSAQIVACVFGMVWVSVLIWFGSW